jgi:hypothetical protein
MLGFLRQYEHLFGQNNNKFEVFHPTRSAVGHLSLSKDGDDVLLGQDNTSPIQSGCLCQSQMLHQLQTDLIKNLTLKNILVRKWLGRVFLHSEIDPLEANHDP